MSHYLLTKKQRVPAKLIAQLAAALKKTDNFNEKEKNKLQHYAENYKNLACPILQAILQRDVDVRSAIAEIIDWQSGEDIRVEDAKKIPRKNNIEDYIEDNKIFERYYQALVVLEVFNDCILTTKAGNLIILRVAMRCAYDDGSFKKTDKDDKKILMSTISKIVGDSCGLKSLGALYRKSDHIDAQKTIQRRLKNRKLMDMEQELVDFLLNKLSVSAQE